MQCDQVFPLVAATSAQPCRTTSTSSTPTAPRGTCCLAAPTTQGNGLHAGVRPADAAAPHGGKTATEVLDVHAQTAAVWPFAPSRGMNIATALVATVACTAQLATALGHYRRRFARGHLGWATAAAVMVVMLVHILIVGRP